MNEYKSILKKLAENKQLIGIDLPKGKPLSKMPNNKLLVQSTKQVEFLDMLESREISLTSGTTLIKLSKSLATNLLRKINDKRKLRVTEAMLCIVDGYTSTVTGVKHVTNKLVLVDKEMLDTNRYSEITNVMFSGRTLAPEELILSNEDTFNLFEVGVVPLRVKTNRSDVYLQVVESSKQPTYKVVVRVLDPKTNTFKIQATHKVTPVFRDTTQLKCIDLINHIQKLELREAEDKMFLTNFRGYIKSKNMGSIKEFCEALLEMTPYKFLKSSSYSPEVNAAYIYSHIGQEIYTLHSLYIKNQLLAEHLGSVLPASTSSVKKVTK